MSTLLRALCMLALIALSSCVERESSDLYTYFMLHPSVLKKEIAACNKQNLLVTPRCQVVMRAAEQIVELIDQQQRDPQAFGQHILKVEMQAAKTGGTSTELKILLAVAGLSGPE
jgi:hypothetical protein